MRYRAFISYSNADRAVAEQFQRAVERYRIPAPLRGADHGFGPTPRHVTPLFRDRSDGDASADLGQALNEALENSEALVVLCSPASAVSKWCNEEIRTFKRMGRAHRIFPVLVAGLPKKHDATSQTEGAFSPALFERYDQEGKLVGTNPGEPLAPDVRDTGDGLHFARLKIVAALTGIPLTLLTQRQEEAARREKLIARAIAGGMSALALLASISAVMAWRSEQAAVARMDAAIDMAGRRVEAASEYQDRYGVPAEVIEELLSGAQEDFARLQAMGGSDAPMLGLGRGRMLVTFAEAYGKLNENERQLKLARDGLQALYATPTTRSLFRPVTWFSGIPEARAVDARKLDAMEAVGQALDAFEGNGAEVAKTYEDGLSLAEKLDDPAAAARFWSLIAEKRYLDADVEGALKAHDEALTRLREAAALPGEPGEEASREVPRTQTNRAEMMLELGRHEEALEAQASATEAFRALAETQSGKDKAVQVQLAQAIARLGDMKYAVSGKWPDSVKDFETAISMLEQIHKADPARVDYARELSIALERMGDARLQTGRIDLAMPAYERCVALRREILLRNEANTEAQRDVMVAIERLGDVALANGKPVDAQKHFTDAIAVRQSDAGTAPADDLVLLRDIAIMQGKRAKARALRNLPGWRDDFDTAIAAMTSEIDKGDALPGWMRDVAVFHSDYGDALRTRDRARARAEWKAALALVERQLALGEDDPRLINDRTTLKAKLTKS